MTEFCDHYMKILNQGQLDSDKMKVACLMRAISVSSSKHFYSFEIGTIENDNNCNFNTAISQLYPEKIKLIIAT